MNRIYFLLIIASCFISCETEERPQLPPGEYQINVSAKGALNGIRAYIMSGNNRQGIAIDTAIVVNESFSFTGTIKSPAIRSITMNGVQNKLDFVFEEGITNIDLNTKNIGASYVDGPINNQGFQKYYNESNSISDEITTIRSQIQEARNNGDNEKVIELSKKNVDLVANMRSHAHKFISKNSDMTFSLLLLESRMAGNNVNFELFKENLSALRNVIGKSPENGLIGKNIENFIQIREARANLEIGKVAPNFKSITPEGEKLSLNDIKGKVTIIDFWASWCKPCRLENPNIVKVYEEYHDKGLEIVSVSLDRPGQKDRWLKAIEDDNLPWHHVGSLQYWQDPVAKLYNITSIPAAFILDESGTIVAKRLRGPALGNKIAELLN